MICFQPQREAAMENIITMHIEDHTQQRHKLSPTLTITMH